MVLAGVDRRGVEDADALATMTPMGRKVRPGSQRFARFAWFAAVLGLLPALAGCGASEQATRAGRAEALAPNPPSPAPPSADAADPPEPSAAPSAPPTTTTGRAARRLPTPDAPLRVLMVGDSVGMTFSGAVVEGLAGTGARLEAQNWMGFGLTSGSPGLIEGERHEGAPNFANWPERFAAFVEGYDPDAVVVLIGAWDVFDREVLGRWLVPGTPEWRTWYDRLLDDAVEILTGRGAHLYWLTFPCTDTYRDDRVPVVNDAYRALTARWPDRITLVDLHAEVCPGGRYEPSYPVPDGTTALVRDDDGVHFDMYVTTTALAPWVRGWILAGLGLG